LVRLVHLDPSVFVEVMESVAVWDSADLLAPLALLVLLAFVDRLDPKEVKDNLVVLEPAEMLVSKERKATPVLLAPKELLDQRESTERTERMDRTVPWEIVEITACKVSVV